MGNTIKKLSIIAFVSLFSYAIVAGIVALIYIAIATTIPMPISWLPSRVERGVVLRRDQPNASLP